ncbi:hypothetical protein Tco_1147431 [Tanacetum coccineum]
MSWQEFILDMGLHTAEEIESVRFDAYWAESARQIPNKGDLSAYWIGISSAGDFLGTTTSYTSIRDLILRLCLERITKKRTKNEAKSTKPDSEWKSRKRQSQSPSPSLKKSTQVNPEAKSQEKQV